MSIGENIRRSRKELHMTLDKVAVQVGISMQTLCRYESGKIPNIPPEKIVALAKVLETTPSALLGWPEFQEEAISDDAKSGRMAAKEAMYRSFGDSNTTSALRACGDCIAVLYYKPMERNAAPALLELINAVDELPADDLIKVGEVVRSYLHAKSHIRRIVDVALESSHKESGYGKYQEDRGEVGDQL